MPQYATGTQTIPIGPFEDSNGVRQAGVPILDTYVLINGQAYTYPTLPSGNVLCVTDAYGWALLPVSNWTSEAGTFFRVDVTIPNLMSFFYTQVIVGALGGGSSEATDALGFTPADRLAFMLSNADWPFAIRSITSSSEDTYVVVDFIASTKQPIYYGTKAIFSVPGPYYLQLCLRAGSPYDNVWVFSTLKSTSTDSDVVAYKSDGVLTNPVGGYTIVTSNGSLTTTGIVTATSQVPTANYTITEKDTKGNLLVGVMIWITSDIGGSKIIAGPFATNSGGQVTFQLPPGSYFAWRMLAGYNFDNPQAITV